MIAEIKIITNRIYFEQFEAPCGEPEVSEIKMAWESAVYDVIESAGFSAETDIGVGKDPAVQKYVTISVENECDCDDPSPDCDCAAKAELPELVKLLEKCGELIADQAIEAGWAAANKKSEEFVKASEELKINEIKEEVDNFNSQHREKEDVTADPFALARQFADEVIEEQSEFIHFIIGAEWEVTYRQAGDKWVAHLHEYSVDES